MEPAGGLIRLNAMRLCAGALLLVMVASCGSSSGSGTDRSGVDVVATVDAGCPVQQVGSTCPTRPVAATVQVRHLGSTSVIVSVTTGSDGLLHLSLGPGRYVLTARADAGLPMQQPQRKMAVVPNGAYASVTFSFDSGIRGPVSR
jgi:hypothetical protein